MRYYKLNKDKSLELYNDKEIIVEKKACYTNIFMIFSCHKYWDNFFYGNWKIAYGYMQISEDENLKNMYCRHAFILDENEKVIDVTLALLCDKKSDKNRSINEECKSENKYIVMKTFNAKEYLDALEQEDGDTCLYMTLKDEYSKLLEWSWENGIMLCG